ncbi:MAG: DNA polymerase/3'-5' exonuclease PolX, partial [Chitinophagaceae bacterium]
MAHDNYYIADQFTMLAKLMDINGENSFKSKSYSIAAFNIEKLPEQLHAIERKQIATLKGIGDSTAKKIIEILDTGKLKALEDMVDKTPPGVAEMLSIKGLGPKKIATVWKEMGIESIGELLYACNENRLTLFKGFGEKTQKNVQEAIEFYTRSQGNYLYAQVETHTINITDALVKKYSQSKVSLTGAFRRQLEIITELEWVTTIAPADLTAFFTQLGYKTENDLPEKMSYAGPENIMLSFHLTSDEGFNETLFKTSCSEDFLESWQQKFPDVSYNDIASENDIFLRAGIDVIHPALREKPGIIEKVQHKGATSLIQPADIRGIIHSHSTWSDGSDSIEQMAKAAIGAGLEY